MTQTHAPNTPAPVRRSLASRLLAMLSLAFVASTDASMATSRRAMLAERRLAFANESAQANPVKDIAVGFILLGVSILVALAFWPAITSSVATAVADGNTSDSAGTVLGLIPLILAVGLLVGAIAFLFRGIKSLGD